MVLNSTPMELDECYALNFKIKLVFSKMALVFCFKYIWYIFVASVNHVITLVRVGILIIFTKSHPGVECNWSRRKLLSIDYVFIHTHQSPRKYDGHSFWPFELKISILAITVSDLSNNTYLRKFEVWSQKSRDTRWSGVWEEQGQQWVRMVCSPKYMYHLPLKTQQIEIVLKSKILTGLYVWIKNFHP